MRSSVAEGPLFIVDNSEGGRNGLDYLREWSELASSIDIATGYFEIGSLLDLDGHWATRRRTTWRSSPTSATTTTSRRVRRRALDRCRV